MDCNLNGPPPAQGLYKPQREKDACGLAFVAHIKGNKSHQIIEDSLQILKNLTHRGAAGADPQTGDGAGIMIEIPDRYFRKNISIQLPDSGAYACGLVFLPTDPENTQRCEELLEKSLRQCQLEVLGWREIVTDNSQLGEGARVSQPTIKQIFVATGKTPFKDFTWNLYRARRLAEKACKDHPGFYIVSLNPKTIIYKGMFLANQLGAFYPELHDEDMISAVALVHQRFSTNTFPSWQLAHPFRLICHNGEVNTIQGNINQMRAREANLFHPQWGKDLIPDILPLIPEGLSDSGSFDAALEFLLHTDRSLPHALAMMIPEAWGQRKHMNSEKKDFYRYHANLMEPWDGPAALAAFDGRHLCAILDRNGLRPARFCITKDHHIIFGSEAGMLPIPAENISYRSRVWPGKMIMVDIQEGTFKEDDDIKASFINSRPYKSWLEFGMVGIDDLPDPVKPAKSLKDPIESLHRCFHYTEELLRESLAPMAISGQEPVGAMGNDAPLAILDPQPRPLFDYFRQKFAQVTNPAIDPIREEIVMGAATYFGSEWNMFADGPEYCHQVKLNHPFLSNLELEKIAQTRSRFLRGVILPITMDVGEDPQHLASALQNLFQRAEEKISLGYNALILSDRSTGPKKMAIPSVLAVAGVHHYLVRKGVRGNIGIIVETAQACLPHHMAVLLGYGANAINPYLAFETLREMRQLDILPPSDGNEDDYEDPCAGFDRNYTQALLKGLRKVMSKMGISTLRSYRGAQIFEALGLSEELTQQFFTGTLTQMGGIGLEHIHQSMLKMHRFGFTHQPDPTQRRLTGGDHRWRPGSSPHLFNPETITLLQRAVRENDFQLFKRYTSKVDDQAGRLCTLRGLLNIDVGTNSIDISEVEPVESLVKRFCSGAMSLGSISKEAHETLAIAMNRLGGKSNTGEGGEDPARFVVGEDGELRRSAIKQVASGRFGVNTQYLINADEIQIKIAQGAKPGEGGQLPGHKVSSYIAQLRNSIPGVTLISPPPHHDIYSIEDLAQLIYDLKMVHPKADVSVKLVAELGVGTVAAGVAKAHADVIIISGHDGGTGASPISSIKHAGIPWELGLAETHQTLSLNRLRNKVRLQADGQMKTGRDVIIAALLGAEEFGFATAPLVAEGCIMTRKCHLDTCPVGIATQNPRLRQRFTGKVEHVENFFRFIAEDVRQWLAAMGVRKLQDIVGEVERLGVDQKNQNWKSQTLQWQKLLYRVPNAERLWDYQQHRSGLSLDEVLDHCLIAAAQPALKDGTPIHQQVTVKSSQRSVGAMLAGVIAGKSKHKPIKEGTVRFDFQGNAGQSFAAFMVTGMEFHLAGVANDYVGKGMSGGLLVIHPPKESTLPPEENFIAGNTLLYGATGGKVFISGRVGERFAVRNSGSQAVVEGVGDHGCEYMTGGVVVVIGPTGRNFAAGMSGGVAYVHDRQQLFSRRVNNGMVDCEDLGTDDLGELQKLLEQHVTYTGSREAQRLLQNWIEISQEFVKVMPREYKKVLRQQRHPQQRISQHG